MSIQEEEAGTEEANPLMIIPRIPRHLLLHERYTATTCPPNCELFLLRHRDLPAVFENVASYLFDVEQRNELSMLFAPGWQYDSDSPLLTLVGCVRPSKAHRPQAADREQQRESSVRTFIRRTMREVTDGEKHGRIASDLRLDTFSEAKHLCKGPNLFSGSNMLNGLPLDATVPTQDHIICHILLGTHGAWTAPHIDFCGTDAMLYQVSGEKLWMIGPPESAEVFHRLFTDARKTARIRLTREDKELMTVHHIRVVHQRADELVYVPSGWLHMVKHLTDTVSFGNSYLRPWRMEELMQYVKKYGIDHTRRSLNLSEIVRRWASVEWQAEWGLSHAQVVQVFSKWKAQLEASTLPHHLEELQRTKRKTNHRLEEEDSVMDLAATGIKRSRLTRATAAVASLLLQQFNRPQT